MCPRHRGRTRPGAFTIVELLLGVTLLAILMSAVAVAMHASLQNYKENTKIATATQAARSVLMRLTSEIRTAAAVDATATSITVIPPDDGSGLQQVQYELVAGRLLYRRTVSGNTTEYVLLGDSGAANDVDVNTFSIIREIGTDWQGLSCTKSLTIRIEMQVDNVTYPVTATASPRRNQTY